MVYTHVLNRGALGVRILRRSFLNTFTVAIGFSMLRSPRTEAYGWSVTSHTIADGREEIKRSTPRRS